MTEERLAWVVRTIMVAAAAASVYLLGQTDVVLDPIARVGLNLVVIVCAALNPSTVASKLPTKATT